MITVLTRAGMRDTFSVVYSHAKRLGVRYGIPLIRI